MVIIDIGRNLSRLAMMVLSQASSVAVVMSPDPTSAANTRALLQYMQPRRSWASASSSSATAPWGWRT